MITPILLFYFVCINLVSGLVFAIDKGLAKNNKRRIAESNLHIFELMGGVFANLLLMYVLRHKNKKNSYRIWSWLIFLAWLLFLFFIHRYEKN